MHILSAPIKLLLSLLIGAAIGLERESYENFKEPGIKEEIKDKRGSLGVRTFSLITTLGTLAGLMRPDFPDLFLTINLVFLVLLVAYYVTGTIFLRDNGITTEIAIIFGYLIGIFIALDIFPVQLILAITVVLILILSKKDTVRQWVAGIKQSELTAFISYAIIALVVLPFLPNQNFTITDIPGLKALLSGYNLNSTQLFSLELFNPYKTWFMVALITGIEIFGYLLSRTIGQKKGWLLTSFVGGFVSSTSTTISLAQKSQKSKGINKLVAAAILANLASFFQLFFLIASTNGNLLIKSTPLIVSIILCSTAIGVIFLRKKEKGNENFDEDRKNLSHKEIFSLVPALKFALIYLLVSSLSKVALFVFGETGFYLTSMIAALTGLDAVVLNVSAIVGTSLTFQAAVRTLFLVNAVNLISKTAYSYLQGKKEFAGKFALSVLVIILVSLVGIL